MPNESDLSVSRRALLGTGVAAALAAAVPSWAKAAKGSPGILLDLPHLLPGHRITTVRDGWVLIAGGQQEIRATSRAAGRRQAVTTTYLVDVANNRYYNAAPLNHGRAFHGLATSPEGFVYAVGGVGALPLASIERYDADADRWEVIQGLNTVRGEVDATFVGSNLLVTGRAGQVEITRPRTFLQSTLP
jgi:hypothetical protein